MNYRLRDAGGFVRQGPRPRESVNQQPHLKPSARRDIGNSSSQDVPGSAQNARLLAGRVHSRVRMHKNLVIRHWSFIRSQPAYARLRQDISSEHFTCRATRQPRPIADQSVDSPRRQHTGHYDSTVSICDTDRCFSGCESFTTQGPACGWSRWNQLHVFSQRKREIHLSLLP